MAFSTLLAIALACAGGGLAMLLADNQWARNHYWLTGVLFSGAGASLLVAIASTRWFRVLFVSQAALTERTIQQEAQSNSNAAAIGSIGSIGAGATLTISQGHSAATAPAARPDLAIELLTGFFNWGPFESGPKRIANYFATTLHICLVNRSRARAIVMHCELAIESGGRFYRLTRERGVLPSPHMIEWNVDYHRAAGDRLSRKAITDIPDFDFSAPLDQGIPREGLVQFMIRNLEKVDDDIFQDTGRFVLRSQTRLVRKLNL